MRKYLGLVALALCSSMVLAQTWTEQGDAPDLLPGQACNGAGALTAITGQHASMDVDLYKINISNPSAFSATTVGGATWDTRLFLFNLAGNGVIFNDDEPAGGGGSLQSVLNNSGGWITAAGDYYLGIAQYSAMARNAAGQDIWLSSPFNVIRPPDGAGAPGPLAMWNYQGSTNAAYTIALQGVSFVPEPASLALMALAFVLRRR